MRWWFLVSVLLLASCTPSGPTGYAVAPAVSLESGRALIAVDVMEPRFGDAPVRITVFGDIVYHEVLVDGVAHSLSGKEVSGAWLSHRGDVVLWLPRGEYVVRAYSCEDSWSGWKCGCIEPKNCGNWMMGGFRVD